MLKKENRLKKRKEFGYIYRKGTKFFSKNMTLVKIKSKYENPRIGFSINAKIGKAVVRNKIKRRLRAIFREIVPQIKYCNLIIVAQTGIVDLDFTQLKNEVIYLLNKGKVLDENN